MTHSKLPLFASLAAALLASACQFSQALAPTPNAGQAAAVLSPASPIRPTVAAANPQAVDAGLNVLRAGGGAIDAAVAVQAVLGLVEPQSSGLGGGSFMVYYDAKTKAVTAYDGREVAPAAAGPDWFLKPDGAPMGFFDAIRSGRSTGVPGAVAMLALAQKEHGKRPWSTLFGDAERLARDGFLVNARLAAGPARGGLAPDVAAYLRRPDGTPIQAGDLLKNPAYANTIHRLATEGPKAIYEGEIARAIVARVGQAPVPSPMTEADLKAYKPHESSALCRPYRIYKVCTTQAPSGGVGLLEGLGIFQNTDIAKYKPTDAEAWYLFTEGSELMYADRDKYVADPAFVKVPVEGLLDPAYEASRARLIGEHAGPPPAPGVPAGAPVLAMDRTNESAGTTHFVIMDAAGNVVSMTTTVESPFGSGRMVGGFILNNQLTDFSLNPKDAKGAPVANSVMGGKRPRSSMSPAIILDRNNNLVLAVGSPGGNSIIAYNLKAIIAYLDWKLPLQAALDLPNLVARGPSIAAETAKFAPGVLEGLAAKGVTFRGNASEESGLHGIGIRDGKLEGAADPRRPGVAKSL